MRIPRRAHRAVKTVHTANETAPISGETKLQGQITLENDPFKCTRTFLLNATFKLLILGFCYRCRRRTDKYQSARKSSPKLAKYNLRPAPVLRTAVLSKAYVPQGQVDGLQTDCITLNLKSIPPGGKLQDLVLLSFCFILQFFLDNSIMFCVSRKTGVCCAMYRTKNHLRYIPSL